MSKGMDASAVSIPHLYIKRLSKEIHSIDAFKEEFLLFTQKHGFDFSETIYLATLKIIKSQELFNHIDKKVFDSLLYDAISWASKIENRKKIRPKGLEDAQRNKANLYSDLQKELTIALLKKHKDPESYHFRQDLSDYLTLFFELACIKRTKKNQSNTKT